MDIRKFFVVVLFSFFVYLPNTTAQFVLPVFSGYWYWDYPEGRNIHITKDNCNQKHLDPKYVYSGTTQKDVATQVITQLWPTKYCEDYTCKCQLGNFIRSSTDIPSDFPSPVTEWYLIVFAHPELGSGEWQVNCYGNNICKWCSQTITIYPHFQCPTNSRVSYCNYDDRGIPACGTEPECSTTPGLCSGDIIGRDMGSSNGVLGHVAIAADYELGVVEVLNKTPVIQGNSLYDFRKASPVYWGTKYGLPDTPYITWDQGFKIVTKLRFDLEDNCRIIEYSLLPEKLHLCQFDPDRKENVAILRCDYFVNEAYKAAGLKIVDFSLTTTPRDLFDTFSNYRFAYDPGSSHQESNKTTVIDAKTYLTQLQRKLNHFSWHGEEHAIEDILSYSPFDGYAANLFVYPYIKENKLIPNRDKQRFLWDLAIKYRDNKDKFQYLLDALSELTPVELVDEIIAEYYRQNTTNKLMLLWQPLWQLCADSKSIACAKVRKLFKDILFYSTDIEILKEAIHLIPVPPEEHLMYIDQVFKRPDIGNELKKDLFATRRFYLGYVTFIFFNVDLQKKYLKDFIDQVEKDGDPHLLNRALYAEFARYEGWYASPADRDPKAVTSLDPAKLDDSVRLLLIHYLETHQPAANLPERHGQDMEYYAWLRTYMAVQSKDFDEMRKRIADYIKSVDDLPYKAVLLLYTDKSIYDTQFSNDELVAILKAIDEKYAKLGKFNRLFNPEMETIPPEIIAFSRLHHGKMMLNGVLKRREAVLIPNYKLSDFKFR